MFSRLMKRVRNNEAGATAIEYGLIAALIAIAAIGALQGMSGALNDTFGDVKEGLEGTATPAPEEPAT